MQYTTQDKIKTDDQPTQKGGGMIAAIVKMLLNGQKFNTGMIVVVLATVLQQLGMEHDLATQTVSQVMVGIGGVWALIGFVHGIVKQYQGKKQMPAPTK